MNLGLVDSVVPDTLTFLDDPKFIEPLLNNPKITAVITTPALAPRLTRNGLMVIEDEDPRWAYFTQYNERARAEQQTWPSEILGSVHASAYVSETNVRIGAGTAIGPKAVVLPDVEIGRDCVIQAGTVIGSGGFEVKRTSKGLLSVVHDGIVKLGDRVEIGANCCVDKGFRHRPTLLADDVKIDNHVHVAHCVQIGSAAILTAGVVLAGSCSIGDGAWLSVSSCVAPGVRVGSRAFVSIGAAVVRNVPDGEQVTGNLAIPHATFMRNFGVALRKGAASEAS